MKLTENLAVKITAVFVVFFTAIGLVMGAAGTVAANELGIYTDSPDWFQSQNCADLLQEHAMSIAYGYATEGADFIFSVRSGQSRYAPARTNLCFILADDAGNIVCDTGTPDNAAVSISYVFAVYPDGAIEWADAQTEQQSQLVTAQADARIMTLRCSLPGALRRTDVFYYTWKAYSILGTWRGVLPWIAGISALLMAVSVVFLCCAAGHHAGREGISLNPQDRIPFDFYLLTVFGMACIPPGLGMQLYSEDLWGSGGLYVIVAAGLLVGVEALICLAALLTTATRFKKGGWWRNTVIWRSCHFCWRLAAACLRACRDLLLAVRLEWRVALGVAVFLYILALFWVDGAYSDGLLLAAFCMSASATLLCVLFANGLRRVVDGGRAIAGGSVDYKIDTTKLAGILKRHGEDLNSIADGMGIAVEQRMRSERMKTELITNVSHDIKTPLTSIINYVDLLKKEPLEGKAREYADTLERHANRLKKLTEDLVEASKAATGNIRAELVPVNFCELINQAVGEYSERLEQSGIEPVVALPEHPKYILADGRLLWRIIENLLSNAAKYSQPGTRLYISLVDRHGRAVLEMKNISRDRLNIDADELMERFVRADSSRHTEGSGLGLNIARSLAELQNARLAIEIDGDLFKVSLAFDRLDDQLDFIDEMPAAPAR